MINEFKTLYADLEADAEDEFLRLARSQYEATEPHGDTPPDAAWLAMLLLAYDPVTTYVYRHEALRKRDRTAEAVNSVTAKAQQMDVGARYWVHMGDQYCDTVAYKAAIKAYADGGVKEVRWVTEIDGWECDVCRDRDGKVFPIDKIPDKTHWGCRCYVVPV